MVAEPITVEVLDPPAVAFVNEPVPLNLVIRCPLSGQGTVIRAIQTRDKAIAELDIDLFERDTPMRPGEVYRCTVFARFHAAGRISDSQFVVIAGIDKDSRIVSIPTTPLRVVP